MKMCGHEIISKAMQQKEDCPKIDWPKELTDCFARIQGHAQNIVEITDATAERLGIHKFAVIEPQEREPSQAVLCTWSQPTAKPVIPEDCKKKVLNVFYGADAFTCSLPWNFKIVDCNTAISGDPGYSSSSSSSAGAER
jgi:hypothetical protein